MRGKFKTFPSLKTAGFDALFGASTKDDFRWLRLAWEVNPSLIAAERGDTFAGRRWCWLAKGGEFSPYYADVHLLLNWGSDGVALKASVADYRDARGWGPHWAAELKNAQDYFRPGLTWPRRTTSGLSFRALPSGCVFADKGPALFSPSQEGLPALLGLCNSRPLESLATLSLGAADVAARSYEVGIIQRLPIPFPVRRADADPLGSLARFIHDAKRSIDTTNESSRAFVLPALADRSAPTLQAQLEAWNRRIAEVSERIVKAQHEVEETCYRLLEISAEDRETIELELGTEVRGLPEPLSGTQAAAALVSWMVGVVLGRFDVRLATGNRAIPAPPDPFAPLRACSVGMLLEGRVPTGYPIVFDEDGILVDGEGHPDDVLARVREVIQLLWRDRADAIEKEACGLLAVKSLRDYFGRMGKGGFWDDHFRRYTKSRRRAPILWPLQSPRGLVRLWLYAHKLTKDTLPKVLGPRYIGGMLAQAKHSIEELRPGGQAKPGLTKKEEKRLADLDEKLVDLEEFAALVQAAIQRTNDRGETVGYVPDLNDGVVLAAAPLHDMIPWPKTRKHRGQTVSELRAYWDELAEGEYDWAHVAMLYWPTRVGEKCSKDKSLALAHGLDARFFPGLQDELRRHSEAPGDAAEEAEEPGEDGDEPGDEE